MNTEIARKLRKQSTIPERFIWSKIRAKQLGYKFKRQFLIDPYIVDFCCRKRNLVIEIDGRSHDDTEDYDEVLEDLDSVIKSIASCL